MSVEIEPLDELSMWDRPRPGELAIWVRWTIAVACAVTVAVIAASTHVLWRMDPSLVPFGKTVFQLGPPIAVAIMMAIGFAPRSSTSRFIRLAIVLPLIHVIAMLAAWWLVSSYDLASLGSRTPLAAKFPIVRITVVVAAATALAAVAIARRRGDWIQAVVTIALANLLLLGLWTPIACRIWSGDGTLESWEVAHQLLQSSVGLVSSILLPPFVLAALYAALVLRAPRFAHRQRAAFAMLLLGLFTFAIALRIAGWHGSYLLYDNFVHVLLGTAFVAIVATATLGAMTWFAGRTALTRLARTDRRRGIIVHDNDGDVVACLEIASWLRGPRLVSRSFAATTERGELMVPSDCQLASTLPLVSSVLRTGEAVVVVRTGDTVDLAGFVDSAHGDGPFRQTSVPVPGPHGILVSRAAQSVASTAAQSMGLAAWRPAIAYLIIVVVIAIPGLLGALAPTWK